MSSTIVVLRRGQRALRRGSTHRDGRFSLIIRSVRLLALKSTRRRVRASSCAESGPGARGPSSAGTGAEATTTESELLPVMEKAWDRRWHQRQLAPQKNQPAGHSALVVAECSSHPRGKYTVEAMRFLLDEGTTGADRHTDKAASTRFKSQDYGALLGRNHRNNEMRFTHGSTWASAL